MWQVDMVIADIHSKLGAEDAIRGRSTLASDDGRLDF